MSTTEQQAVAQTISTATLNGVGLIVQEHRHRGHTREITIAWGRTHAVGRTLEEALLAWIAQVVKSS